MADERRNRNDVEIDGVAEADRGVRDDVLAILGEHRQADGVVRQHLLGDLRDAREHLAHVERLKERRQQRV